MRGLALAHKDEIFLSLGQGNVHGNGFTIGNIVQPAKGLYRDRCIHRHLSLRPESPIVTHVSH